MRSRRRPRPRGGLPPLVGPSTPVEIGRRLRQLRELLDLTQDQIANRCGLSTPAWNHYETGENAPGWPTALVIAQNCGVDLNWIYAGDVGGLSLTTRKLLGALRDPDGASIA
jgi:transcriptional regulator with XRE-family HTH domain